MRKADKILEKRCGQIWYQHRYNNQEGGAFPSRSDCWYQCFSEKNEVVRGQKNKGKMKKMSYQNDYEHLEQFNTQKKRSAKPRHYRKMILRNISRFYV